MAEYSERERQRMAPRHVFGELQGHWRVVSSQVGDEKAPEAELKKRRITFTEDKLTYESGNEQQEKREGTVKVDPSTKALDWTVTTGETKLALYQLQGDDLKIGLSFTTDSRF